MNNRVVITGLGVVSPNGVGLDLFTNAIKKGVSGIEHHEALNELNFLAASAVFQPFQKN